MDMQGRHGYDWPDHHRAYIGHWDHRLDHLVIGDGSDRASDQYTDAYMSLYTAITRRLIGPVIQMPTVGFQPVGSITHLLEDTMTRISQISDIPSRTEIGGTFQQDLFQVVRHINDLATACLAAVDEDRQLHDREGQRYTQSEPSAEQSSPIPDPRLSPYVMELDPVHVGGDDGVEQQIDDVPLQEPAQHGVEQHMDDVPVEETGDAGMETECVTQDVDVQPALHEGPCDVIVYKRRRSTRGRGGGHGRGHCSTHINEDSSQLTQATLQTP